MINLLPPTKIAQAHCLYRRRRREAAAALSFVWFILLVAIILSLFGLVRVNRSVWEQELARHRQSLAANELAAQEKQLKIFAARVDLLTAPPAVLPFVISQTINEKRNAGIAIGDWHYLRDAKNTVTMELAGIAATRQDLLDYLEALRATPLFSAVDSPIANLIKDKEVEFTLLLKIKS